MSILIYVLNFLLLGALVWWMQRQTWAKALYPYFYPALGFKLLCGVLLGLLYTHYYAGGDTTSYHRASLTLTRYASTNPQGYAQLLFFNTFESEAFRATIPFSRFPNFSNSFYFIKLLSVLNFLTGSSYYLNSLYLSLFSFWGAASVAAALKRFIPDPAGKAGIVAFLFMPSVVFWSAGLSKDTLMFGCMCLLVAFALATAQGKALKGHQVLLVAVAGYVFFKIKLFFAVIMLPLLLWYVLLKRTSLSGGLWAQPRTHVTMYGLAFVVVSLGLYLFHAYLPFEYALYLTSENYYAILARSLHGPHVQLEGLEPTVSSMLRHYPEATLSTIYRPFFSEAWEPLYVLVGIENLLLLLLSGMSVAALFSEAKPKFSLHHGLFLLFVLLLGGVVGLSTPNFGSLSRYRIVFLPFLVYLLLQNRNAQAWLQRLGL
ncbi:hypothetical protein ACXYMU_13235 [Pontibacter sp. CAU 1760]